MAGREAIGAKLAREGDQVDELHALVAQRARHRRPAARIFVDEAVDHAGRGSGFRNRARNGRCRAGRRPSWRRRCPGPAQQAPERLHRLAMIVELQRDADHLGAGPRGERGRDRAVDAAGHGDDDPGIAGGRPSRNRCCIGGHSPALYPNFTPRALEPESKSRLRGGSVWRVTSRNFRLRRRRRSSLNELLALARRRAGERARRAQEAIACYLSASDGWRGRGASSSAAPSPDARPEVKGA